MGMSYLWFYLVWRLIKLQPPLTTLSVLCRIIFGGIGYLWLCHESLCIPITIRGCGFADRSTHSIFSSTLTHLQAILVIFSNKPSHIITEIHTQYTSSTRFKLFIKTFFFSTIWVFRNQLKVQGLKTSSAQRKGTEFVSQIGRIFSLVFNVW